MILVHIKRVRLLAVYVVSDTNGASMPACHFRLAQDHTLISSPSYFHPHPMYKMSHLSYCRHHQIQGGLRSKLLLLKAQAVAMMGDLQAAIDIVTEWQQMLRDSSTSATVSSEADDASSWQKAWQEAAEAKDAGNDLFRRGDFKGDCCSAVFYIMLVFSHHALQSFVIAF